VFFHGLFVLTGVLFALASSGAAQARSCHGIDFPEHLKVDGSDLSLNGLGVRKATFLKVNVYVAALYVVRPSSEPGALLDSKDPQELTLQFVRSVGAGDIRKGWSEGFERSAGAQLGTLQGRIARLNGWMSDVQVGQRLTFIRHPGMGVQVSLNGTVMGVIEGDDFARAFVGIWLGATPPNAELKTGLLGGPCE